MSMARHFITERQQQLPVLATADVVVVGGGPAGITAAVSAARNGMKVILLERYPYLGGLASGGMVLVLDDMCDGPDISVKGLCTELVERMTAMDLCVVPPEQDRHSSPELWRKWSRWGVYHLYSKTKPAEICYAAAFDPDGFKRAANDMVSEAGIELRLHSWFSSTIVEDGRAVGVICDSKEGRHAVMGSIIIDASGDLDVAASAGAEHTDGSFVVTTVFRLGGVDTEEAERFEYEEFAEFQRHDREVKRLLGGSWEKWWLKTPLPGVVWCNCPHMSGLDGTKIADLTRADIDGRRRMNAALEYIKANMPGFRNACLIDVAPQLGVRTTRLLQGQYVMTKQDVVERTFFEDTVARGRDYFYSYRSFLPKSVGGLLVAGRHYSSSADAQRISREIPPCMAMGEAVGAAAAIAIQDGVEVANVNLTKLRTVLRNQGADPGDAPVAREPALAQG